MVFLSALGIVLQAGDSSLLLSTAEAMPGVAYPVLGYWEQEPNEVNNLLNETL